MSAQKSPKNRQKSLTSLFSRSLFSAASCSLFLAAAALPLATATVVGAAEAKTPATPLYKQFAAQSFPSDRQMVSITNPWGERAHPLTYIPFNFGEFIATAAQVYSDQGVRFDGYLGSDDDGSHYTVAVDGKDNAFIGDEKNKTYNISRNGKVDDLKERSWVCLDYPMHTLTLAGFPIREAMIADWQDGVTEYTYEGRFPQNKPVDLTYFRRVLNMQKYLQRKQLYWEERITPEQYRDPAFRPIEPFKVGDILILGHYGDDDGLSVWMGKHSGIVGAVDARGMPTKVFNMRVSSKMYDNYDGVIDQSRKVNGQDRYFKRFSDRYSLAGHGRIVNPYTPSLQQQFPVLQAGAIEFRPNLGPPGVGPIPPGGITAPGAMPQVDAGPAALGPGFVAQPAPRPGAMLNQFIIEPAAPSAPPAGTLPPELRPGTP